MNLSAIQATFSADWLRLREPSDRRARDAATVAGGAGWADAMRRAAGARSLRVLDLGCGTGANLRWLAPRLGGAQRWIAVDRDGALLQAWPATMAHEAEALGHQMRNPHGRHLRIEGPAWSAVIERRRLDLASELDALPLRNADLVCASALIDLASRKWLVELLAQARRQQCTAAWCLALTVDGRIEWDPVVAGDVEIARYFAHHQRRDKGLSGPALGPDTSAAARHLFTEAGYDVTETRSDWLLEGAADQPLRATFIGGMAMAAAEQASEAAPAIERWREARLALLDHTRLRVGHVDLVALPRPKSPSVQAPNPG